MTNMELCRSLQYLSDEIISEADAGRSESVARPKRGFIKYAALAACAVIAVSAAVYVLKNGDIHVEPPDEITTQTSVSEPADDSPLAPVSFDDLPKITLPSGSDGCGSYGIFANDISEIVGSSPLEDGEVPPTLPVYRNATKWYGSYPEHIDYDKMVSTLKEYAALWGLDADNLEIQPDFTHAPSDGDNIDLDELFTEVWGIPVPRGVYEPEAIDATQNGITVRVIGEYQVTVWLNEKLPEEYMLDTYENALKTAEYLKEKYADKIGIEDPEMSISGGERNVYGETVGYEISFYAEGEDSRESFLNHSFRDVRFSCIDGKITVMYDIKNLDNRLGDYPTITAEEAKELFKQGKYIDSSPEDGYDAENIVKTELVYLAGKTSEYYIPCYKMYVYVLGAPIEAESDMHLYDVCYVPAIEPRFIDDGENDTSAEIKALPQLRYGLGQVGMGFEGIILYSFDEWKNDNPWFGLESELYGAEIPAYAFQTPYVSCGGNGSFMVIDCDEDYMREELKKFAKKFGADISDGDIKDNSPKEKELEKVRESLEHDLERGYLDSEEEIEEILRNYSRPNNVTAETEDYIFEVSAYESEGYTASVKFKKPVDLGISGDGDVREAAEAVAERYGKLILGDGETVVGIAGGDRNIYGEASDCRGFIYSEGRTAVETLLNYSFGQMNFRINEDGLTRISAELVDRSYEKLGDYIILGSEEEVLERMRQGKYLTTVPVETPDLEKIASIELCYRSDGLPYFKLWIEITDELKKEEGYADLKPEGMYEYGAYYVPAVIDEYIDGSTPWDGGFN